MATRRRGSGGPPPSPGRRTQPWAGRLGQGRRVAAYCRSPLPAVQFDILHRAGSAPNAAHRGKNSGSCRAFALRMLELGSAQRSPGHRAPDAQPACAREGGRGEGIGCLEGGGARQAKAWRDLGWLRRGPYRTARHAGAIFEVRGAAPRRRPPQAWCGMPDLFGVAGGTGTLDGYLHGPVERPAGPDRPRAACARLVVAASGRA